MSEEFDNEVVATQVVALQPEPEISDVDTLAPNEVILAQGTEFERKVTLKIPRGRQHRDKHRKLLSTFAQLEQVTTSLQNEDGSTTRIGPIIEAIEKLFGLKDFEDVMIPFALGMESDEDKNYLDNLLPMEKFMAYMSAASFIVSGGNSEQVRAAIKK